jgi:23S rRNA (guanosine2251-2'-O)-methyltransferase
MKSIGNRVVGKKAVLEHLSRKADQIDLVLLQENKRDLQHIVTLCKEKRIKWKRVPRQRLDQETELVHQGVVARIFSPGFSEAEDLVDGLPQASFPVLVALDQIQDSGNLGVLARTLYALGGGGLIIPKDRSAAVNDRARKSSAGTLGLLPLARISNMARFLRYCQERMYAVYYAGTGPNCRPAFDLELALPAVLVLGNEEKGVRPGVIKDCHQGLTIPMSGGFDSLNVAQAGAMLLGEFLRQRQKLD